MPEQPPNHQSHSRRTARAVAALIIAGSGMAGCHAESPKPTQGLPRCYEQPQPALFIADQPPLGEVNITKARSGVVREDPGQPDAQTTATLARASVKVSNVYGGKQSYGSGFITTNTAGEHVVVTAAHVAATNDIRTVSITDRSNNLSDITSGCIMYESYGNFADMFRPNGNATLDIAILRLSKPVGTGTLTLADTPPPRGSWEPLFYNFPRNRAVDHPALYSGVVAGYPSPTTTAILTGIQSGRSCEPEPTTGVSACAVQGGASGSPAAYRSNARVFGMVIASSTDPGMGHLSPTSLRERMGISLNVPAGAGTGNWPVAAITVDAEHIRRALASRVY